MLRGLRKAAVVGALAGAAALLGCGGGSSFEAQANKVCSDYRAKVDGVPKPTTLGELSTASAQEIGLIQEGVVKLQALTPPAAKQAGYQALLADIEDRIPLVHQLVQAAIAGDTKALRAVAVSAAALKRRGSADARAIGLDDCASSA
jgi:hypothetical protein